MGWFWDFLTEWLSVIATFFREYPLAAAALSVAAIALYFHFIRTGRHGKYMSAFIIIMGWSIAVPIAGFVMDVFSEVYRLIVDTVTFVKEVTEFFYTIYRQHPIMVIVIIGLGVLAYFAPDRMRPLKKWPKVLRGLSLAILTLAAIAIADPFADMVSSPGTTDGPADAGHSQPVEPPDSSAAQQVPDTAGSDSGTAVIDSGIHNNAKVSDTIPSQAADSAEPNDTIP